MTTLEDKILGEKNEYYCSSSSSNSSDSESENESGNESSQSKTVEIDAEPTVRQPDGNGSANTGPKGVIKDWQRYKQLEAEQRIEKEREKLALIQKLSLTCRSDLEQEKDAEIDDLVNDPFILEYSKRRMQEMYAKAAELPKFGEVINLSTGEDFLDSVDKENPDITVIVHIYEENAPGCLAMNECLKVLSRDYPHIKFCKMLASVAGLSKHFKVNGIPALLVYKNGNLIGNYVQLKEEFGKEFESSDVENYLIENGVIIDNSCIPRLLK